MSVFSVQQSPVRGAVVKMAVAFWFRLSLMATFILALGLYSQGIAGMALNFDEGATLYFARLPLMELWGPRAYLETNPPLYYSIQHVWMALAEPAGWNLAAILRLPSVVAAALCVPAAGIIARGVAGPGAGALASLLLAGSAAHLTAAQDSRCYAMVALAGLVACGSALRLARGLVDAAAPASLWTWAVHVLACIAAVYLHDTAILFVAMIEAALLASWLFSAALPAGFLWRLAISWGVFAAVYGMWLPVVLNQSVHTLWKLWMPVPRLVELRYWLMGMVGQPYLHVMQPLPDLMGLLAGGLGAWRVRRVPGAVPILGLLLIGLPVVTWCVSQWRPIMNGKTLECLVPVFLILAACGVAGVLRGWARLGLAGLLVCVQFAGCAALVQDRPDEAYPDLAAVLRDGARPGDVYYLTPLPSLILLGLYGFRPDASAVVSGATPAWYVAPARVSEVAPGAVNDRLLGASRIWVVVRHNAKAETAITGALAPSFRQSGWQGFGRGRERNLSVALFERR
jgi:hypothetical protein